MRFTQILLLLFIVSCNVAQMKPQIQSGAQGTGANANNRVSFANSEIQGNEAFIYANIPVTFQKPLAVTTQIYFSFTGSAKGGVLCAGKDYIPSGTFNVTSSVNDQIEGYINVPAGAASAVVSFEICNDNIYEGDEVIQINIAATSSGLSIGSPSTLNYILKEKSARPTVSFATVTTSVNEGNAGSIVYNNTPPGPHIQVTLNRSSVETVAVNVVLSGTAIRTSGACSSTVDYRLNGLSLSVPNVIPVTFSPLQTSYIIPIEICGDTIIEPNESIDLSLQSPLNAIVGAQSTHSFMILNDDFVSGDTNIVADAPSDIICDEPVLGVATCIIPISLTGSKNTITYLNYTIDSVTQPLPGIFQARFQDDFYFPAHPTVFTGRVAVAAQASSTFIQVAVKADQLYEAQESFIVKLLPSDDIVPSTSDNTVVYIDASDLALKPRVNFSQPSLTVVESNQIYSVTVRLVDPSNQNLTRPSGTPVTFNLDASGSGSAPATIDEDYFFSLNLSNITIPAGEVQVVVPLTIVQDGIDEFDETFQLDLDLTATSDYNGGFYQAGVISQQEISVVDIDPLPTVSFKTMITYATSSAASDVGFNYQLVFSRQSQKPVSFNLFGAGSYPVSATCSGGQRVSIPTIGIVSFPSGIGPGDLETQINGVVCQETYPPSGSISFGMDTLQNLNPGSLGSHSLSID